MASNHTPNYNLNQWQATDQVKHTDFNEDNAKIDAALAAGAAQRRDIDTRAHPVLLKTFTSGEAAKKVSFELPNIQWSKYAFVVMELLFPTAAEFFIQFNGRGYMSYHISSGSDSYAGEARRPTRAYRMVCPVFYRDDLPLHYWGIGQDFCMGCSNYALSKINTLELEAYDFKAPNEARIPAGSQLLIWGIQ